MGGNALLTRASPLDRAPEQVGTQRLWLGAGILDASTVGLFD